MEIEIVWGSGEGNTLLSAFDSALMTAGIHNYNLVELSSVIPQDAVVVRSGTHNQTWDVGTLVGVVLAEKESSIECDTIAAGIGWKTATEGGIFFEATGESRENVETRLKRGLKTARENRETWEWDTGNEIKIIEHTVEHTGAVIVSAIYRPI